MIVCSLSKANFGIIHDMRFLALLTIIPLAAFGSTLSAPTLPPCEFADTEVTTNIPIRVNLERLDKMRFVLELSPTATNDVEVLIGHDADANGVLSVEESRIVFGYDCGRCGSCARARRSVPTIVFQPKPRCGIQRLLMLILLLERQGTCLCFWTGMLLLIMFRLRGFSSLKSPTRAIIVRMTGRGIMRKNLGEGHCHIRNRPEQDDGVQPIHRPFLVRMPPERMKRIRDLGRMDGKVGPFQWAGAMVLRCLVGLEDIRHFKLLRCHRTEHFGLTSLITGRNVIRSVWFG